MPADSLTTDNTALSATTNAAPTIAVEGSEPGWIATGTIADLDGVRGVTATDFDNDGDLDVVAATYVGGAVVLVENVDGSFAAPQSVGSDIASPIDLAAGDLDGDGDQDLVTVSYTDGTISVRLNEGGTVTESVSGTVGNPRDVSLADLDGDGDLDILAAAYSTDAVVWYANAGDGTFGDEQVLGALDGATGLATTDFDGDGHLDVRRPTAPSGSRWPTSTATAISTRSPPPISATR